MACTIAMFFFRCAFLVKRGPEKFTENFQPFSSPLHDFFMPKVMQKAIAEMTWQSKKFSV